MRSQLYRKSTATFLRSLSTPKFSKLHNSTSVRPPASAVCGLGVAQQAVEQITPLVVEAEVAVEFVEDAEPGREAGFDREVVEDPPCERMQRADRCVIEVVQRVASCLGVSGREFGSESNTEFGRRLLGEGDRGDLRDRDAGLDEVHHAVDQGTGLAGARTGLDEQRVVEVGADALTVGLVGRCARCDASLGVSHRRRLRRCRSSGCGPSRCRQFRAPNHRLIRGSCCLRPHRSKASSVPRPSGSQ